jgi:glycosyltransferase involved in cell wall biosynthesis
MSSSRFGGSEELWTRTAAFLAQQGTAVAASVHGWPQLDQRISGLSQAGVDLRPRPVKLSLQSQVRRYLSGKSEIVLDIERSFGRAAPSLVVISNGFALPPIELAELCVAKNWPFVNLAHSNAPSWWPPDEMTVRWRKVLPLARRCFFVSRAIRDLAQWQLGHDFENAEIVHNPLVIEPRSPLPWPSQAVEQELRMASVGTLFPAEKGQDIILDVLARPPWQHRNWRLTFYGEGPNRDILERLVSRLKLQDRVSFAGYVAVEKIWRENHILVMPSRFEGMPLAIVEAMWCGRPVVATNVGGNLDLVRDGATGFLAKAAVPECFGSALERMWAERNGLRELGQRAAASIREFMPNDPVGIFAAKVLSLAKLPR